MNIKSLSEAEQALLDLAPQTSPEIELAFSSVIPKIYVDPYHFLECAQEKLFTVKKNLQNMSYFDYQGFDVTIQK
jgi:hypothetical protein